MSVLFFVLFFFFKQKTAYEIVSRDWSSDVCSSDLVRVTVCDLYALKMYLPEYVKPGRKLSNFVWVIHLFESPGFSHPSFTIFRSALLNLYQGRC